LILNRNGKLTPLEIKSTATFTPDFVRHVTFFHETFPGAAPGAVVFNGTPPAGVSRA
jgi:hypothetical protein